MVRARITIASSQEFQRPYDLRFVRTIYLALTGLRFGLNATAARNPRALQQDPLPRKINPSESNRNNLRGPPADPEPHRIQFAVPGRDVRDDPCNLIGCEWIGEHPPTLRKPHRAARRARHRIPVDKSLCYRVGECLVQQTHHVSDRLSAQAGVDEGAPE